MVCSPSLSECGVLLYRIFLSLLLVITKINKIPGNFNLFIVSWVSQFPNNNVVKSQMIKYGKLVSFNNRHFPTWENSPKNKVTIPQCLFCWIQIFFNHRSRSTQLVNFCLTREPFDLLFRCHFECLESSMLNGTSAF